MTIRSALSSAVADVLERMFFLEVLGEAAEPPPEAVLSRIESRAAFRLGSPQIVADDWGKRGPAEETRCTVETGSGALTVAIQMETRTWSSTAESAS